MLTPLLLFVLAADPVQLPSKIEDVTLYGTNALVHRVGTAGGSGTYVFAGLPAVLDRDNVRVRCSNGDVLSVEVRDRLQKSTPNERVQALREQLTKLGRDLQAARDDVAVLESMRKHLASLANVDAREFGRDTATGKADAGAWNQTYEFLQSKMAENTKALREAGWRADEAQRAYQEVEAEIGRLSNTKGVTVRDVVVDVDVRGESRIDLEYLVTNTGWQPFYDLRTAADLSNVELGYRARVWQQTGEDWKDVAVALSTAQPQRGAQGPDPEAQWISLYEPRRADRGFVEVAKSASPASDDKVVLGVELKDLDQENRKTFAAVQSQGLSVRFQLARRETIESRSQPTTVLVGRATLAVAAERYCTPALDPTVWMRGKAKNTSEWTMLPGDAAVFLGADYLGLARIDAVQPGQDLTLHLGADPMLTVKRTQTEDLSKGPGFLSSRAEKIEGWRVHLENHGALTNAPDGTVEVIVREVLPRSRDERIEVELTKAEPKISNAERWKQDLDEKGIHTWVVRVPKNGASDVVWQATISYPKDGQLVRP